jgi:hypothetical protein
VLSWACVCVWGGGKVRVVLVRVRVVCVVRVVFYYVPCQVLGTGHAALQLPSTRSDCCAVASMCACLLAWQYEEGIDVAALFAPDKLLKSSNDDYDDVRRRAPGLCID